MNFAYRLLASRADAEDAVQDVHVRSLAAGPDASAETPIEVRSECEAALRHLLRAVSPAEAAAILLRDVFEFDYDEIARIIGKREAAARQFLRRARTRTHRPDRPADLEDSYVAIYWRAIESRDPASLIRMLRPTTVSSQPTATTLDLLRSVPKAARGTSSLVQVNGRYAVAWMLDGVILCIVPVGPEAAVEDHNCS